MTSNLRSLRLSRGLSQEGAAREVGVSWATWQRWETGKSQPRGLARVALKLWIDKGEEK